MSFNIKDTESKVTPAKKTLDLKNISVSDLRLVDTDSGEDISQQVIDAIPFEKINLKSHLKYRMKNKKGVHSYY